MRRAVNVRTHPPFTIGQFIEYTGWKVESAAYRQNMALALDFFQRVVPQHVLRERDKAGPYGFSINGESVRLTNWMQGINFREDVNPSRMLLKGDPVYAYTLPNRRPGNWYTFPSTRQEDLSIYNRQTRLHKFKAKQPLLCMQSTVADAYVGWLQNMPAEYHHGRRAAQLFIWNATQFLGPG